jgi:hypothetical protein
MSFSPNLFLSNIRGKDGLAKPSRFQVVLPIPVNVYKPNTSIIEKILNLPNSVFNDVSDAVSKAIGGETGGSGGSSISRYLSLQCESAELPGRTIGTADVKIYGPSFKVPTSTLYNDMTLTFLCTNDFYERKLFDKWLEYINPSDTNNFRFPKGEKSGYLTNITVIQYDDFIKQIYAVKLIDAFPIAIAPQALSWGEDGFHRLSISFAYQRFEPVFEGKYDVGAAIASVFGSAAARLLPLGRAF